MGKATGIGLKVTTDGTNIEGWAVCVYDAVISLTTLPTGSFVDGLAQGWTRKVVNVIF